ncbi:hypothetical protein ABPG72_018432 [Tetrahymena utriculariae]
MKTYFYILLVVLENFIYGQDTSFQTCLCTNGGVNQNDPCAWITPGCPQFDPNKSEFCCKDSKNCFNVTDQLNVPIGGFKGGRCLTSSNSTFLCNNFTLLLVNLNNWNIVIISGDASNIAATNPVCQIQKIAIPDNCIGYTSLQLSSLDNQSGDSKVCIQNQNSNSNKNVVYCLGVYCKNQKQNQSCIDSSQSSTIYTQYGIIGVDNNRNCLYNSNNLGQVVPSSSSCFQAYVSQVCFNSSDNTCWDLSNINMLDSSKPIGVFNDGSCALLNIFNNKQIVNCLISSQAQVCIYNNFQKNNGLQGCIQWNLQSNDFVTSPFGIYNDGSCAFINDYKIKPIKYCNNKTNGIFSDGSCAYLDKYGNQSLQIQSCNTNIKYVCKYNSNQNNNQQGCINWNAYQSQYTYQPVGIFTDGTCALYNIYSQNIIQTCNTQNNNICIYNSNQNNNNQGCIQWNIQYPQNSITFQPIGVYSDGSCAFYNNYQQKDIQFCNDSILSFICIANQLNQGQGCIDWTLPIQNELNKNQQVGKFLDGSCAYLNTYKNTPIQFCSQVISFVCLDNSNNINQGCAKWDSSPPLIINGQQIVGIFKDGSCAQVNILQTKQIYNCNTQETSVNVCIYNNTMFNSQQGCIQWKNATNLTNFYQSQPIGIFQNQSCAFLNTYGNCGIQFCNNQITDICIDISKNNDQACLLWNYPKDKPPKASGNAVGIYNDQSCAFLDNYANKVVLQCNQQIDYICLDSQNTKQACLNWQLSSNTNLNPFVPIGLFTDFTCSFLYTYASKKIMSWNNLINVCIDSRMQDNQACFLWNNSTLYQQNSTTPIGKFQDGSCAYLNTYKNILIQFCTQNISFVCLDNTNNTNQGCAKWDQSPPLTMNSQQIVGIFNDGQCAQVNILLSKQIFNCNTLEASVNVCIYNNTMFNSQQGCIQWKNATNLTNFYQSQPIGIFQNKSCAFLNTYGSSTIQYCNSQISDICIDVSKSNDQACLLWNYPKDKPPKVSGNAVGIFQDQSCAFLDNYANKVVSQCNQQIDYICLDNSQSSKQACLNWQSSSNTNLNPFVPIGLFTDFTCSFLYTYASKKIMSWNNLQNVCIDSRMQDNQACFLWNNSTLYQQNSTTPIGKFQDGSCAYLNTYKNILIQFCTQNISFVCLDNTNNTNQGCAKWDQSPPLTMNSQQIVGIFNDGQCAQVNILLSKQIYNCNTLEASVNVCIYNNTMFNSQQGCIQWKNATNLTNFYQSQPIGIFQNKSCAFLNTYGSSTIQYCNSQISDICIDVSKSNDQACILWNYSKDKPPKVSGNAVGIYNDQSCAFLDNYANKVVSQCNQQIDYICLDNSQSSKQACLNWQSSSNTNLNPFVPIGLFTDFTCSFLYTYASKKIMSWNNLQNVCIDSRMQDNQACFLWNNSTLYQQNSTTPIGKFQDGSCAYLNTYKNILIQFCTQNISFVCLDNTNNTNQGCAKWDQSPPLTMNSQQIVGIFNDGQCAQVNILKSKQIYNCNTLEASVNVCIYNNTMFNSQQGCIQWKNATNLTNFYQSQPIGIFQNKSCAFLNTYGSSTIQYCNSQISDICIDISNSNDQACILWNYPKDKPPKVSGNAVGIYNDQSCAFLDNYANKVVSQCNQQIDYICLDNSQSSKQACLNWQSSSNTNLNPFVPIGLFTDFTCSFLYTYASKKIMSWNNLQNVCIDSRMQDNQACFLWNNSTLYQQNSTTPIGKFQDGSCAYLNTYKNILIQFCTQNISFVCLDNTNNTNQGCAKWDQSPPLTMNSQQIVGIFNDGQCAQVNILLSKQIYNCNTLEASVNVCIYNNTMFNSQQGCIQWKNATNLTNFYQSQPIGIFQNKSCAFLNTYGSSIIQYCNSQISDICIDISKSNDQACLLWNYPKDKPPKASGNPVGIFSDQSCAFLDIYANKVVFQCNQQIDYICLDNSQTIKQACINWQIQQISQLQPPIPIGLFTDYTCAFLYTYASKQIKSWNNLQNICIDSRNINNEACFLWNNSTLYQQNKTTPIGKYIDGSCAYLNTYKDQSIQYCTQLINQICLDNTYYDNQGCAQWDLTPSLIRNNQNIIGIFNGGNCVMLNIYANTFVKSCNFQIDFVCQDIRNVNNEACLNFSIANNQIVGEDSNHICLIQGQPDAIKCSKNYCIDTDQSCKILDGINRIETQKDTYQCLPSQSETDTSNALWCAVNYCRQPRTNGTYYCIKFDRLNGCKDDQTHNCLIYNQVSSSIIVELQYNFCFQKINNSYKCINADLDQILVIKDKQGQCQAFNTEQMNICIQDSTKCLSTVQASYCGCLQPNTKCVIGPLCLNQNSNCVHLDYSQTFDFPGRMIQTSVCQPTNTYQNELCSKDYCLLNQQCFLMTQDLFVSQEKSTSKCLQVLDTGDNGARFCIQGFCKQTSSLNKDFCIQMTDQITDDDLGFIATDNNGYCIAIKNSKNNPNIYSCLMNIFCLDNTDSCIQIDPTTTCVDSNYKCVPINSNQCTYCHIKQCLFENQCITIPQQFCLGFNGKCILSTQNNVNQICKSCATSYCYDSKKLTCSSFLDMNINENQCLIVPSGNSKCKVVSLNDFNYCADQYGQCQSLSSNPNSHCLRCPKTYVWVGNFTCFSSQMIETLSQKNEKQDDTIFSLSLIYKQLDLSLENQVCGQGCQKCLNITSCLECSFEYYLFDDNFQNKQFCNPLPSSVRIIQYPDSLFDDKDYINQINDPNIIEKYNLQDYYINSSYQMAQVNATCINQWVLIKGGDIIKCDTFNIQYQYISQIVQIPLLATSYQISLDPNKQVKFSEILITCNDPFCISCQKMSDGQEQCLSCKPKYALNYLYQCKECPINCTSCFYGGYYNQKSVNWSLLISSQSIGNINFSRLSFSEYQLLCQQCKSTYVVTNDYTGCEKCGNNCLQCYQANIRFNLTSIFDIALSQSLSTKTVKRCLICQDGFIIGPTMTDCIQKSINCDLQYFGNQDGKRQSFTSQIWWDYSIQLYEPKCYTCSGIYVLNTGAINQCSSQQDPHFINCYNLVAFQSEAYCQLCSDKLPYNYEISQGQCDVNNKCSDHIYQCISCYSYKDTNSKQIYQCTNCKNQDPNIVLYPTFFGCSICPPGCSSCYESQIYDESIKQVELKNRTNQIIYEQIRPSLQDKLNSLKLNDFEVVCSSCQDGYYLLNKLCVKNLCGDSCDLCFMKNYQPICISCSYSQLQKQIQAIDNFILSFYQQQSLNLRYLTHFTFDKKDCFLCPIGCSSCTQNNIGENPYKLYDAQCYSCKEVGKLDIANINPNITKNYEWRWNKETKSCSLCLKNQASCVYRKETDIYVTCRSITDALGSGVQSDPLNLQRASDAQWDSLIVNQTEFKKALVYMNELGVREILANVYIVDKKCVLGESTSITTNLLQLIPKLEVLQINIIGNQNQDPKNAFPTTKINLYNQFSINGFLNVQFSNLDFQQPSNSVNNQIIYINNTDINTFQFNNCSISGTLNNYYDIENPHKNNSKLIYGFTSNDIQSIQKLFFNIVVNNLRSNLEITNSSISNVILYQRNLFSFQSTQKSSNNKLLSLSINNFTISEAYFQQSSIISLQYFNLTMVINNTDIRDNFITQNSLLFMINQTNLTSQCSNSVYFLNIIRNKIYSNSQIFFLTNLVYNLFENILFDGNVIQNQSKFTGLIVANQMTCLQLRVINNSLCQAYIFSNFYDNSMNRQIYMKDSFYLFTFNYATINNNQISLYESSIFYYFGNSKQYNSIKLSNIQINQQNLQDANLKSNLFTIQTCFKVVLLNLNITNINQVTIVQAQNLNYYIAKNINIISNQSQSILKNILFSIQQIFFSIDIIFFNGQNILSYYPIIYIFNGFNLAQGTISLINLKQLNFMNTTVFVQQQFIVTSIITLKTIATQQINLRDLNFQNNNAFPDSSLIITDQFESCSCLCIDAEQSQILLEYSNFTNNYSNSTRNVISAKSVYMLIDQCNFVNQMSMRTNSSITKGGFIYSNVFTLKIQFCFLQLGFAKQGGAIYFKGYHNSQFTLNQTQIFQCRAALVESSSLGGAIFIETQFVKNLNILFLDSQISNNLATISGGAFYIQPFEGNVFFEMTNSIMLNNFALQGAFLDFSFVGDGLGRVLIIQSKIYNDPSINLENILEIIQQLDNKFQLQTQCSLFQFSRVTYIQILDSAFESTNNQLSQLNFTLNQNVYLYPSLFNIRQNKEYNEYSNNYNNFICFGNFISIQSKSISIIQSLVQNIQQQSLQESVDNLILLDSNFIQIAYAQFIGLQCKLCKLSLFYFMAEQFLIMKSLFNMNVGSEQGGLLLIRQQISYGYQSSRLLLNSQNYLNTIKECTFTQNQAYNGGALTMQFFNDFSIDIQECKFIKNQALNKGGAIYYQQLSNYNQVNLNLKYNLFTQNLASIGAILYTNIKQYLQPIKNQNSAISNVAINFGSSQINSPNSMVLYYNQMYYQNNSMITVQSSGRLLYDLIVLLQDDQGQQYKELDESQYQLLVQQISSDNKTFIQNTNVPFQNGIFNLTNYLKIFGKINEILSVQLTFDEIRNGITQNYSFVINFKFNSTCQIGNYMSKTQNNFDLCTPCSNNSFSLIPNSTQCNTCPKVDGFICYSNILIIPNGYWKINQASPLFFECTKAKQNCVGDTKSNYKIRMQLNDLKKDQNSPQIYYCNEGYVGVLCQDCDILGEYWNQKYYKESQFKCQSCKDSKYKLSYQWIYFVSVIGINIYIIYACQKSFENQLLNKISKQLKDRDTKITKIDFTETYIIMKLIINYFQILALILQINPNFLNIDLSYLRVITNPVYEILSQFDCQISELYLQYSDQQIDYLFFRIIFSQITIVMMYLSIIISYLAIFKYKIPSHIYLRNCINIIIIIITLNISGVAILILESLLCIQAGEVYYLSKYTRVTCDDIYYQHIYTYCLPLIVLWAIFIPFIFQILKSKQYELHHFKIRCSIGFLYNQYKSKYFYWELINIIQKIIIAIAITLTDNQGIQFGLSFSTIISYRLLVQKFGPNQLYKFNDLEKQVNICLGFSAIIVNKIFLLIVKKKIKIKTLWSELVAKIYNLEKQKLKYLVQKDQQDYNNILKDNSINLKQFYRKYNQITIKNQNKLNSTVQIQGKSSKQIVRDLQKLSQADSRISNLLKFQNKDQLEPTNI